MKASNKNILTRLTILSKLFNKCNRNSELTFKEKLVLLTEMVIFKFKR